MKSATNIEYIIGLFSIIVFAYRCIYIMIPMFHEGLRKKEYSQIMKSFTLLV